MRLACAMFLLLGAVGCASVPEAGSQPVNRDGARIAGSVELCRTTLAELRNRLGEPSRDGRLGKAQVVTWIVEWEPLVKYLGVMADGSGKVVDLYWNLPSEVPWTPTDRCG